MIVKMQGFSGFSIGNERGYLLWHQSKDVRDGKLPRLWINAWLQVFFSPKRLFLSLKVNTQTVHTYVYIHKHLYALKCTWVYISLKVYMYERIYMFYTNVLCICIHCYDQHCTYKNFQLNRLNWEGNNLGKQSILSGTTVAN